MIETGNKGPATNKTIVFSPRAYHGILNTVLKYGERVSPRGIETLEMINSTLLIRNPVDRVVTDRGRKMNIAFGVAEWVAMMTGIDDINFFRLFINDYIHFSTDGETLDGAYGKRLIYSQPQFDNAIGVVSTVERNQIEEIIEKLRNDHSTRQAVMTIYKDEDVFGLGGKNTPCTLTLQFMIRNQRLTMITNMRSNDVVKGLTYDVFAFTLLQEYVARALDIELGDYIHNAASLHIYSSDYELVKKLARKRWPYIMHEMPQLDQLHLEILKELALSLNDDERFWDIVDGVGSDIQMLYITTMACVLKAFVDRKDLKKAEKAMKNVRDETLKYVLRPWLTSY